MVNLVPEAPSLPSNILMMKWVVFFSFFGLRAGKTEIARRLSKLANAPFVKVEATKFTEVGFHGRDVDQIIRDLVEASIALTRKRKAEAFRAEAARAAETRILDTLTGLNAAQATQSSFREMLRKGVLDDRQIDVDVPHSPPPQQSGVIQLDQSNPVCINDFLGRFSQMASSKGRSERKRLAIRDARPIIEEQELEKLLENIDVNREAVQAVEESGIVFIDEIDKIVNASDYRGADASAEGVQRDLLPLIEGSTIATKYGNVNTDYVLFIASGAFHQAKPSDLLAELQGRLPIRVELEALTEEQLYKILTEPKHNLIAQQSSVGHRKRHVGIHGRGDPGDCPGGRSSEPNDREHRRSTFTCIDACIERIIDEIGDFHVCDYRPGDLATILVDEGGCVPNVFLMSVHTPYDLLDLAIGRAAGLLLATTGSSRIPLCNKCVYLLPTAAASSGRRPSGRRCRRAGRCPS